MALVPYVAAAVPTEEEELIGHLSSALLAWLPEDNGLPLIELDYSDEQAIEKVTLACVERYFGLLVEFVNITRSAEPIDPRVLAGTFFHADKLCRFQLTAAHGERASRRVTSEEAEKLHMIWRYAYRQYLRTPDSSRSAKLMRLKATMFRYEPRFTVRDRPAIYPDRLPRRSEPPSPRPSASAASSPRPSSADSTASEFPTTGFYRRMASASSMDASAGREAEDEHDLFGPDEPEVDLQSSAAASEPGGDEDLDDLFGDDQEVDLQSSAAASEPGGDEDLDDLFGDDQEDESGSWPAMPSLPPADWDPTPWLTPETRARAERPKAPEKPATTSADTAWAVELAESAHRELGVFDVAQHRADVRGADAATTKRRLHGKQPVAADGAPIMEARNGNGSVEHHDEAPAGRRGRGRARRGRGGQRARGRGRRASTPDEGADTDGVLTYTPSDGIKGKLFSMPDSGLEVSFRPQLRMVGCFRPSPQTAPQTALRRDLEIAVSRLKLAVGMSFLKGTLVVCSEQREKLIYQVLERDAESGKMKAQVQLQDNQVPGMPAATIRRIMKFFMLERAAGRNKDELFELRANFIDAWTTGTFDELDQAGGW